MATFESSGNSSPSSGPDRDTLYLLGGVALLVFGAGLILSSPTARRLLGQAGLPDLTQIGLPDVERYMKMRSM